MLLTPGLYRQPVEPVRSVARLARGDIAAFVGYARRGPVGLPVRVESLHQLEAIFGQPLEVGYLWHALKGFFETGGRTAYILRLAKDTARQASVDLGEKALRWRAIASFPWSMIDPRKLKTPPRAEAANWSMIVESVLREKGSRTTDPGTWANQISMTIRQAARCRTETIPMKDAESLALPVASLAGLEKGSVINLSQTADEATANGAAVIKAIDTEFQTIVLDRSLQSLNNTSNEVTANRTVALDPGRAMRLISIEFDINIYSEGKLSQTLTALSPHPDHSFSVTRVMAEIARDLALKPVAFRHFPDPGGDPDSDIYEELATALQQDALRKIDWADHRNWLSEGDFALSGGTDGLKDIDQQDYLGILEKVQGLPEAALIAAPDLVLQPTAPPQAEKTPREPVDCCDLSPSETGMIYGLVVTIDETGSEKPLPQVEIDIAGPGGQTRTNAIGVFKITGIPAELVTVRLSKTGFEPLEYVVQATLFETTAPTKIIMDPVAYPAALPAADVRKVQTAMANPAIVGPYKIAILDPVSPDERHDDLRTWRARLGDSARIGFFGPWLRVPSLDFDGDGLLSCPPSGHVCGAFAAAEAAEGIHRSGANRRLRYVEGVTLPISDAEQAVMNPIGLNAIRTFPGRGTRVFGTRTLSSDSEWRMLTARRIVDALEKTLQRGLHWMVFEPNNLMTRHAVSTTAEAFLNRLWRDGVLAGDQPEAGYSIKCDLENNPDETREAGQLIVDISVAPTTPFEFVLFRLGHAYDAIKVTEEQQ